MRRFLFLALLLSGMGCGLSISASQATGCPRKDLVIYDKTGDQYRVTCNAPKKREYQCTVQPLTGYSSCQELFK